VGCTRTLRERFFPDDGRWTVERGSALDENYIRSLGQFDIVYSWGVLHHTGDLRQALNLAAVPVRSQGRLLISIYNDQGGASRRWARVKVAYNRLPRRLRFLVVLPSLAVIWGPALVHDIVHFHPFRSWRNYGGVRGMSAWHDLIDWVGGYPFEVARPEEIFEFYQQHGFRLEGMKTCAGGKGCNEFLFLRER
jgi:hypothetical protein